MLAGLVFAAHANPDAKADRELHDLLALLDGETALATKTGINADFVPGMVSILSGEDLLIRGARTVWESLSLVPGLSQGLERTGERQILSRGAGYGYASGNIKILLDGVSMNSSLLATANAVLNIPIEQVERIEVIRGPGSSLYGEYAYLGVVNVITRKNERRLHLQASEGADRGGGGVWSWADPARALSFSINMAGLEGDGSGVYVSEDALGPLGQGERSNAPGRSNEAHRYKAAFANLQWHDTSVDLKLLQDEYGDYFGINHFLPPGDHNLASNHQSVVVEVAQKMRFSDALSGRVRLELLDQERDRDRLYVFPESYLADQSIDMDQDYRETRYLGAAEILWRPDVRHEWLFGAEASQVKVDEATWSWSNLPFEIPPTWLEADLERTILGAVVQDQYRLNDHLTLTGTLRYDDYSDAGSRLSPRAAAVWRIDDVHILKFQYARAFRPPTFYELEYASQASLDSSEIASYEIGYVMVKPRWEGRLTLFHSDLVEPILFDEIAQDGYVNGEDARLRGLEVEYIHRIDSRLKLDANLSYVDAARPATGEALPGGAHLLGNLALIWSPRDRWTMGLQLRYVGARQRAKSDSRPDPDAYESADLTLNYRMPIRGLSLHAGIKNLLDSRNSYLDQAVSVDGVDLVYSDGYPRSGRRWWLSLGYAF